MTAPSAPVAGAVAALVSLDATGRSGAENMARDVGMLRDVDLGRAAIRLYRWEPACLSLGRNEPALSRYDVGRIEALGLAVVRRPTGGRAVWHAHEVTYAVAGHVSDFGSLRQTYEWVHRRVASGLRKLGVAAELAPAGRPASPAAGACFAAPVGGEVMVRGRKLVGSAQMRDGDRFLQHGSILLDDDQDVVALVTRGPARPAAATAIRDALGSPVTFDVVARTVAAGFRGGFASVTDWDGPRPDPTDLARFADSDWTWRR